MGLDGVLLLQVQEELLLLEEGQECQELLVVQVVVLLFQIEIYHRILEIL
jgi:hypothetical protein